MKTIDELIADAENAVKNADEASKPVEQAKLDQLKTLKGEGLFTQADFNRHDRRLKEQYEGQFKEVLGMDLDEAKEVFEQLDDDTLSALSDALDSGAAGEGDSSDGEEGPRLQQVVKAVNKLQADRDGLSETLTDLNRRYSKDKVEVAIEKAFRDAGLDDAFLAPAKSLAAYDDLVKKVADGKPVTSEEIGEKVESVKNLSGVWFKTEGDEGNGTGDKDSLTVAGHRLKEEAVRPAIPATPNGNESAELTDEDRAAKATSVY